MVILFLRLLFFIDIQIIQLLVITNRNFLIISLFILSVLNIVFISASMIKDAFEISGWQWYEYIYLISILWVWFRAAIFVNMLNNHDI